MMTCHEDRFDTSVVSTLTLVRCELLLFFIVAATPQHTAALSTILIIKTGFDTFVEMIMLVSYTFVLLLVAALPHHTAIWWCPH